MHTNNNHNPALTVGMSTFINCLRYSIYSPIGIARLCLWLTIVLILASCAGGGGRHDASVPEGFVDLSVGMAARGLPLTIDVRYFGQDNFVGERIDGYQAEKIFITSQAAMALFNVQSALSKQGLGLKIFDAYRPQRAVDHFVRWAEDLNDTRMKAKFYPQVEKANLFRDGYIASRSGHSRGSTVDLTLIKLTDGSELDMGTPWDFFDLRSWPSSDEVTEQQRANRHRLRDIMLTHGFKPLAEEWWHFTLVDEPFPDTYFDFLVK